MIHQPSPTGWNRPSASPAVRAVMAPPGGSGAAPRGGAVPDSAPIWAQPNEIRRRQRGDIARYVMAAIGGIGLIGVLAVVYMTAGEFGALVVPILLAFVPLAIVLGTVMWIDRWEPEPFSVLLAAFLWGAGVATAVSLVVNTTTALVVSSATGTPEGGMLVSSVLSAPLIEELTKGLGVLIIFLVWRRSFNGPVDGIVYSAVVAAGFAFAENILYFVNYSDVLLQTFVMRGIASPFAHVTFTACTGLAIGLSARMRSRSAWVWTTPIGLALAIALHAFWNGVLAAAPGLYFLVEVPFFLACVGLVIWLRWSERMRIRHRLEDYARAGWFDPAEVTMLTTSSGRSAARKWARAQGPHKGMAMKELLRASLGLAALRQQALDGHAEADYAHRENELLETIRRSRQVFRGW